MEQSLSGKGHGDAVFIRGSIRDDNVIETANKYGITMAFTGQRLFHH